MIAKADIPRIRERHVVDSLRAALCVDGARSAYDFGSGAGLPGIPVAIAVPGLQITLVEARRRRASFLELAVDALALPNVAVFHGHAEHLQGQVDLVLARAFTKAAACWAIAEPLLAPGGRLVYFAGAGFDAALETPSGATTALFRSPSLANSGPLAIMSRQ
jgi:16S rRNA (guanine527-N7)-methyltransferase